jgi:hypothetical protein
VSQLKKPTDTAQVISALKERASTGESSEQSQADG